MKLENKSDQWMMVMLVDGCLNARSGLRYRRAKTCCEFLREIWAQVGGECREVIAREITGFGVTEWCEHDRRLYQEWDTFLAYAIASLDAENSEIYWQFADSMGAAFKRKSLPTCVQDIQEKLAENKPDTSGIPRTNQYIPQRS